MNGKDILNLGFPEGPAIGMALAGSRAAIACGCTVDDVKKMLSLILERPEVFIEEARLFSVHEEFLDLAEYLSKDKVRAKAIEQLVKDVKPKDYRTWGADGIEPQAKEQMDLAMNLPIAVAGALMPDAHLGYGLPIGGVVGLKNAIIPNAVGVDIACRMKLSVFDISPQYLGEGRDRLKAALLKETQFGVGAKWEGDQRREHAVLDDPTWQDIKSMNGLKDKAWEQLGTSGSGNHFVEFGTITVYENSSFGLVPGEYLALLSHSGSRGPGAITAKKYNDKALAVLPACLSQFKDLAWLSMDSEDGQEYWEAMNLMGRFASANHHLIHSHIAKAIGAQILGGVENHHNFAWKETHADQTTKEPTDLIVHRKGATPAGTGVLGVIPGSMASPCFVVRGKGDNESLSSASHGAGRLMSRKAASKAFVWQDEKQKLEEQGVEVLSCGIDEVPGVYKNIRTVMAEQEDLVESIAEFHPKLVRMSDGGKAED